MAIICPKCEGVNRCACNNCNPDGDKSNLIILLEEEQLYQCCFCGYKFDEQDSLDFEWDRMIQEFAEKATPELCLRWIILVGKDRKNLEKEIGIGEFGFEKAFQIHFKMNHKDVTLDKYNQLKKQVERDLIISNIINQK